MQASPPTLTAQSKHNKKINSKNNNNNNNNNNNSNEANHPAAKRTHSELNILNVVLGNLLIKPWYPSFYPKELVGQRTERLYVCQWCFKYSKELVPYVSHLRLCPFKDTDPPGMCVYAKDEYAVHEIDGEENKLFAQNLSLFAKLFLEMKSVFYDVMTFMYYLLIHTDSETNQRQIVGFFSKEKLGWDNNNLACILVFPPWQKRGLGQILMGVSYELSKRERKLGGPERPLSELGQRAYLAFWSATLARYIIANVPDNRRLTVKEISESTYILPDDVIATLKEMNNVIQWVDDNGNKGGSHQDDDDGDGNSNKSNNDSNNTTVIKKANVRAWMAANGVGMMAPVDARFFRHG